MLFRYWTDYRYRPMTFFGTDDPAGGGGKEPNPDPKGGDPDPPAYVAPATQDELDKIITARVKQAERAAAKANETATKDLEAQIRQRIKDEADLEAAKEQGKYKELSEKQEARIADLEAKIAALETDRTKATLDEIKAATAKKYGLPDTFAARLTGDDEAAIETDAKALAKEFKIDAPNTEGGSGNGGKPTKAGTKPNTPRPSHRFGSNLQMVPFPGREEKAAQEA